MGGMPANESLNAVEGNINVRTQILATMDFFTLLEAQLT